MGRSMALCYYCDQVKPIHAWGLCDSCYQGIRKHPDGSYLPKNKQPEKKCKICGGEYHALDLCVKHYNQTPKAKARTKRSKAKPENKAKARIRVMEWRLSMSVATVATRQMFQCLQFISKLSGGFFRALIFKQWLNCAIFSCVLHDPERYLFSYDVILICEGIFSCLMFKIRVFFGRFFSC